MSFFDVALFILAVVLLVVWTVFASFHFISLVYGKYKFHKKPNRYDHDTLPGVTIIKPLMGVDDNLMDNLETYFCLDYPKNKFEILFCVQDTTDPVITVVNSLIEKYPNIDAKLFSGGKHVGINPKINNMIQGYDKAKYELLLISDAGIKMAGDTLLDMVSLMTDKVGLVHQMPFTTDRPGFAGTLEKVYFGTGHCRMYLFINLIGVNCVTGMSCLMRKCVLDKVGGLEKFGNYIAEDYFIAQTFLDNNWVIQLSHQPGMQNSASFSIPMWKKRMIRWCKLRLKLTVLSWLEPMQECFMLGLCTSWTVNYLFGWNSLVFFLIHVLGWFICDYTLLLITQNGKLPFSKFEYVIAWFYRESICIFLFLKAASNPTVKWRNGKYRLRYGGLAEEIIDPNVEIVQQETKSPTIANIESSPMNLSPTNATSRKSNNLASFNSTFTNSKSTTLNSSHKRTNSYSLNSNSFIKNHIDSKNYHGSNSDLQRISPPVQRSQHQQHHSISSPISNFHPSASTAALIDLGTTTTKSPDLKII